MVMTMFHRPNSMSSCLHVPQAHSRKPQRGMMLLEVLIAVMVFSIGILGIVGLQAASIRHVNDAQYRGEAIFLANALVSQMWADDRTATTPAYLDATYGDSGSGTGYAAFKEMVKRLPGTELSGNAPAIKVAPGPTPTSSVVTVTVFWQLPGEPSAHNFSTSAVIGRNP
jgi:type IV pilus assembly protein PilV